MRILYILILTFSILTAYGAEKQKVVVLNFKAISTNSEIAEAVTELFITALANSNNYHVIERSQLNMIFNEMNLTSSEEFNETQIIEIGRLAKAQIAFVGSITRLGSTYTINSRAIEIQTGNVISAKQSSVTSENDLTFAVNDVIEKFSPSNNKNESQIARNTQPQVKPIAPEIKSELDLLKKNFVKRRNSGTGLLVSGVILSAFYIPTIFMYQYATELRANASYTEDEFGQEVINENTEQIASWIDTGATLLLIIGLTGSILFIVGIPITITSIFLYSKWKNAERNAMLLRPFYEEKNGDICLGIKLSFN